jgi:competence protein ComEC
MIRACLGLLAGAYAPHFTSFAGGSDVLLFAILGSLPLLWAGRAVAAGFLAGLILFLTVTADVVASRLDQTYEGDSMLTVLQVVDFPRRRGTSISFLAESFADARIPRRIRVSWYDAPEIPAPGELWQLEVRLKRPRSTSNPGVFDYETWLFRERIGATGYVVNGMRNQRMAAAAARMPVSWRERFVDRVMRLGEDPGTAAVIVAVTVGARHLVSPEQWLRYARSGTTHLMAISGLHVGLAAAAMNYLALACLALLRFRGNQRRIALCAALLAAAGYASLSGFAVPAERATLMFALLSLALASAREPNGSVILAATCTLVLLADPLATLMPGFVLSFAAVLLLLWLSRRRARLEAASFRARIARLVRGLSAVQVFLLIGLTPFTILLFGRVSVVAPVVNLVAVPLFSSVTVPMLLAGFILGGPAAPVGDGLLRFAASSIGWLEWLIATSLSLPFSTLELPKISGIAWLYLALLVTWAALPAGWPGRQVAWLGCAALALYRVDGPPARCFDATVLDVGQGLAVVIRTRDRVLLYDTAAAYPGGANVASRVILPYLAGQGIDRIDRLVVSHSDIDHAGGIEAILADVEIGFLQSGEPLDGILSLPCRRGESWGWSGVTFRFLHPPPGTVLVGNDASCVLRIRVGDLALLLTGDIEAPAEQLLIAGRASLHADAAVVPHHGSDTSSSRSFVEAVAARLAIVSAGYRNRWGLPKSGVVERWRDAGAEVSTTSRDGALSLRVCADGGIRNVRKNREEIRRIWHEAAPE